MIVRLGGPGVHWIFLFTTDHADAYGRHPDSYRRDSPFTKTSATYWI